MTLSICRQSWCWLWCLCWRPSSEDVVDCGAGASVSTWCCAGDERDFLPFCEGRGATLLGVDWSFSKTSKNVELFQNGKTWQNWEILLWVWMWVYLLLIFKVRWKFNTRWTKYPRVYSHLVFFLCSSQKSAAFNDVCVIVSLSVPPQKTLGALCIMLLVRRILSNSWKILLFLKTPRIFPWFMGS